PQKLPTQSEENAVHVAPPVSQCGLTNSLDRRCRIFLRAEIGSFMPPCGVADPKAGPIPVTPPGGETAVAAGNARRPNARPAFLGCSAWVCTYTQRGPQTSVEISVTECLLQDGEGRLAGAVARGDEIHFVGVVQRVSYLRDDWILSSHQVETASEKVDVRI